ncbi:MAG: hypothetical protein WDN69_36985 [Aliidongia sp.]
MSGAVLKVMPGWGVRVSPAWKSRNLVSAWSASSGRGEERLGHQRVDHFADGAVGQQMAGPDAHHIAGTESRAEERQAFDMVIVGMRQEDVEFERRLVPFEFMTEHAQPAAGIEDQSMPAATDLDTGRVAAIAQRVRARRRNAAAHAPEFGAELVLAVTFRAHGTRR